MGEEKCFGVQMNLKRRKMFRSSDELEKKKNVSEFR
jgi:hypothetical protein